MDIRPYTPSDREAVLNLFDANAPELFPPAARTAFETFLLAPANFLVAEHNGAVIGCGGYEVAGPAARLRWMMIHPNAQRQGVGRFLLFYCMREITKAAPVEHVSVSAPQQSAAFFTKQGFRESTSHGSTIELVKRLIVCA